MALLDRLLMVHGTVHAIQAIGLCHCSVSNYISGMPLALTMHASLLFIDAREEVT